MTNYCAIPFRSTTLKEYSTTLGLLFTVTRAPRYFGILQDHRGQPLSVEISEEYMDQDYIATNRKRHKINWNKNPLDMDDFDDDETDEVFDEKDKDVKLPNKFNLQSGLV
ncbi:jg16164 [Pararge aegeria aegeria]|uniref:Jg16164 protein n=1 Tax=Pararge aegeria aegeria TaxID=348720 RepID=A0A8S4RE76_9NEOP|nr:jg16164 [Pararge aegeria aegeria]